MSIKTSNNNLKLHKDDLEDLLRSGLSNKTIEAMGCFSISPAEIRERTGVSVKSHGYAIPYPDILDQTGQPMIRVRLRKPGGKMKYVSGIGDDPQLYIPPGFADLPKSGLLIITEGEKKAAKVVQEGLPCVAVGGVWNWCSAADRAGEIIAEDRITQYSEPIARLLELGLSFDRIEVLGDSDLLDNPQAKSGFAKLTAALRYRNINARLTFCPPTTKKRDGATVVVKQGVDDWLTKEKRHCMAAIPALFLAEEIRMEEATDTFHATQFAYVHRGKVAYSFEDWLRWHDDRWRKLSSAQSQMLMSSLANTYASANEELRQILSLFKHELTADSNWRETTLTNEWLKELKFASVALQKAAKDIKNLRNIKAALSMAKSPLGIEEALWDSASHLFAVNNGVIDLRTGALHPALPEHYITQNADVDYSPEAKAHKFLAFLEEVQPDPEVRTYLQTLIGYCICGAPDLQRMVIFQGRGANGKSVFMKVIPKAMGDYAAKAPYSLLAEQPPGTPRPDLAMLPGKRLVSISELPANFKLDEACLKSITGGDSLTVRKLYKDLFTFEPRFSVILDSNHHLEPREGGDAFWRRVETVPWPVVIPVDKRDPQLAQKLMGELPGILAWIIEGATRYHLEGLKTPSSISDEKAALRGSFDPFGTWWSENVLKGPGLREQSGPLYQHFLDSCAQNGFETNTSSVVFARRLRELGLSKVRISGLYYWSGISARRENEEHGALVSGNPTDGESSEIDLGKAA